MTEDKQKHMTPEIRFKGFSDDWEQRKLGDVVKITMGQSPDSANYTNNPDDNILVQGNADMKNGRVVPRVWTTQVTKTAEKGDLILSVRAPVGNIGKTDYNVILGRGVASIKGNEFIYQLLSKMNSDSYWRKLSTGSTFESINSNDIKNAHVELPKTEEQELLGNFFVNLDLNITLHQQKYDLLLKLKRAYLTLMFPAKDEKIPNIRFTNFQNNWEQRKLLEIVENIGTGKSRYESQEKSTEAKYEILGSTSIIGYDTKYDYEGDFILTARVGANAGTLYHHSGRVKITDNTVFIQDENLSFLFNLLNYFDLKKLSFGTGQPLIKASDLKKLKLFFPTSVEQSKVGSFFTQLDNTITLHQQKIESLKSLKQAYLQKMFV